MKNQTLPEQFTRSDAHDLGPWVSINQALAWVATRIGSFSEFVGHLETSGEDEHSAVTVHAIAENMTSLSDEGAQFLEECETLHAVPAGSIFAHAGRALMKEILAGSIVPSAFERGRGRVIQPHELAGLGRGQFASDWFDIEPRPMFAVDQLLRAFPEPSAETSEAVGPPTVRAEHECREWLIQQFAMDPLKKRPKSEFKAAAQSSFRRLSGRGFTRVWDSLADEHGRNRAGAKTKSVQ